MGYPTLDYRQVRDSILRDIANKLNIPVPGKDSDYYVRANASGSAIEGLYEHQKWIARQQFADTADEDILETKHANPRGIFRKTGNYATGTVRFSGTVGSPIGIGCEGKVNGIVVIATASGVIGADGTVVLAAKVTTVGLAGNLAAGTKLTLTSAPNGVQSTATVVGLTGGTERETWMELLARVLFDIRLPNAGGADHDYYKWAMAVPGVTDAYVFSQRRTPNSVDVVIETAGGIPSAQLIADVHAYIESKRPPCVDLMVMPPTRVPVNIGGVLALDGISLVDALAEINKVLTAYFATLHVGDVVRKVKIESLITSIAGVVDVTLTSPSANVLILADASHSELAALGVVDLTA